MFALSGAVVGVKRRLDIFGVLVLSFAAASAGGIMRDLLIDSVPPAAIRDWRYMAASVLGGLLIFIWFPRRQRSARVRNFVLLFDAGGLALFAVTGTQKALGYGLNPVMASLLGMLTGIGGGAYRGRGIGCSDLFRSSPCRDPTPLAIAGRTRRFRREIEILRSEEY